MDSLTKKKKDFRSVLANGDIKPLIKSLKKNLHEESQIYKTLILVESRFKVSKRRRIEGVLNNSEFITEESIARQHLLQLIDEISIVTKVIMYSVVL